MRKGQRLEIQEVHNKLDRAIYDTEHILLELKHAKETYDRAKEEGRDLDEPYNKSSYFSWISFQGIEMRLYGAGYT